MKRNKLFLLGLFVVFAAVLSLSLVSSTFAKYTSSGAGEDTARVAKWGVTIDVQHDEDAKTVTDTDGSGDETHISVVQDLKLLAPGTKGDLISVNVEGEPEVAVSVEVTFTITLTGWEITSGEYLPLVFTANIAGTEKTYKTGTGSGEYANIAALKTALEADINKTITKSADADLADDFDLELSWEWAFSTSAENDEKDTALGKLSTAPTMTIEYEIQVVQID